MKVRMLFCLNVGLHVRSVEHRATHEYDPDERARPEERRPERRFAVRLA
jgi:hypothetical protein